MHFNYKMWGGKKAQPAMYLMKTKCHRNYNRILGINQELFVAIVIALLIFLLYIHMYINANIYVYLLLYLLYVL